MDEKKNKRKIPKKVKVLITVIVCSLLVVLTATYLTYLITHKDSNRNIVTSNEHPNTALIQKNMIDAFKDTKDTGKFSFSLNDDDINKMLVNASNHILQDNKESIYIESKDNHYYFYIDLKPTLFVPTRVVIDTLLDRVTTSNEVVLKIDKVSMGKLPYLNRSNYLNEDFFNKISEYSLLPIKYSKSTSSIITYPYRLMDYFLSNEYSNILKELIKSKPEVIKTRGDSLFGFDIDFTSFRSESELAPKRSESLVDLKERVESSITSSYIESLELNHASVAASFKFSEFNRLIYEHLSTFSKEVYESQLTLNKCELGFVDLYVTLTENTYTYRAVLSINGYEIDLNTKAKLQESFGLALAISTAQECKCGGVLFTKDSIVTKQVSSFIKSNLTKLSDSCSYIKFNNETSILTFDFRYLELSISTTAVWEGSINLTNDVDPHFDFVITRLA